MRVGMAVLAFLMGYRFKPLNLPTRFGVTGHAFHSPMPSGQGKGGRLVIEQARLLEAFFIMAADTILLKLALMGVLVAIGTALKGQPAKNGRLSGLHLVAFGTFDLLMLTLQCELGSLMIELANLMPILGHMALLAIDG